MGTNNSNISLDFWTRKNVLVTGASGFIGSWLVADLLKSGANIVALIPEGGNDSRVLSKNQLINFTRVSGRIDNLELIKKTLHEHKIEAVFHLAAQALVGIASKEPLETFETNVRGTYLLLEACRAYQKQLSAIVVFSSDKAYGQSKVLPYTEEMNMAGRYPYDASKSCADIIARAYSSTYELPIVVSRLANVYGGADFNYSRIIPATISACIKDEPVRLRSDGSALRSYVYVKDVVRGAISLAENASKLKGEAFNLSSDHPYQVNQLVQLILYLMDCKHLVPIIENNMRDEIAEQHLSAAKLEAALSWKTQYTLEEGLRETIAWYREKDPACASQNCDD